MPVFGAVFSWQNKGTLDRFTAAAKLPSFSIIQTINIVLNSDDIWAGSVPLLDQLISVLPDRPFDLHVNVPLSSLRNPAASYPFATRQMTVQYSNRPAVPMLVPLLNEANTQVLSDYVVETDHMLYSLLNQKYPNLELTYRGLGVTSESAFDAERTVPNDTSESNELALSNWQGFGVTPQSVVDFYAHHVVAMRESSPAAHLLFNKLNPLLAEVGHAGDGGASYNASGDACLAALNSAGLTEPLITFDQTLVGTAERDVVRAMALKTGAFACQLADTPDNEILAAVQQADNEGALFIEVESSHFDTLAAAYDAS